MVFLLALSLLSSYFTPSLASHGLDGGGAFDTAGPHSGQDVGEALPDHIDPNGYVLYCPCMGRFGNQAEQLLGTLDFVKSLNRTYVVPPFVIYPPEAKKQSDRVPFNKWFSLKVLKSVHRTITMEEFFATVAPVVWKPGSRIGHCRTYANMKQCNHKEGNPFGPFWNHFGVDFDGYEHYDLPYDAELPSSKAAWLERFPGNKYPVIALAGAVGPFPMDPQNWPLQKIFQWSSTISGQVKKFLKEKFNDEKYIGIHLRNGIDWSNACEHVDGSSRYSYMASPQCTHGTDKTVTREMCLPSESTILKEVKKVAKKTKAKFLFVASDSDPMVAKITKHLKSLKVTVVTYSPGGGGDLRVELAILQRAEHFIANCVSSVSSFVSRHRRLHKRPTSFFAFSS